MIIKVALFDGSTKCESKLISGMYIRRPWKSSATITTLTTVAHLQVNTITRCQNKNNGFAAHVLMHALWHAICRHFITMWSTSQVGGTHP